MDVLTTREIQYTDDNGEERNVVLTIYTPYAQVDRGWRGAFAFGPPIARLNGKTIPSGGVDFIQCFMCSVEVARGYLMGSDLAKRVHWHGMRHFGLPYYAERPVDYQAPQIPASEVNPGNLEILTKVRLGIPHRDNEVHELILIVYRPFAADETKWKCAFAFGAGANEPVRYGIGADFIEALLDALALARVTYEAMVPAEWQPESDEFDSVQFWPHKIGREYFTEPSKYSNPDMPDFTPSSSQDDA